MAKRQHNLGFTLLEAMIVVVIVGIVASMAVPSYQRVVERNRLKQAAESLLSDMQFARTQAIKLSQNVIVSRTAGNNGAWCYGFNTVACNCSQADSTQPDFCSLKRVLGSEFTQTNLTTAGTNTTFSFRRGTANSSNACFGTSNYKLKVVVNNAGKAEICTGTVSIVPGYETCSSNCP